MRDPYGINELNDVQQINDKIRCHVRGCETWVKKPNRNRPSKDSLCSKHGIYVHTTTYIYQDPLRNLLWHESEDTFLFAKVTEYKRGTKDLVMRTVKMPSHGTYSGHSIERSAYIN